MILAGFVIIVLYVIFFKFDFNICLKRTKKILQIKSKQQDLTYEINFSVERLNIDNDIFV